MSKQTELAERKGYRAGREYKEATKPEDLNIHKARFKYNKYEDTKCRVYWREGFNRGLNSTEYKGAN